MEAITAKKLRIFRGEEKIVDILNEYKKSNLSIKAFCAANHIASATFHNWKKKYGGHAKKTSKQPGFARLQIAPAAVNGPALFAEVNSIRIYQPVSAAYLKELLA